MESLFVFLVFWGIVCVTMLVRNQVVFQCRDKAIGKDYSAFKAGKSYDQMMWQWNKWTYKQFYGEKK